MVRWVCPACDREFGRAHQAHLCAPGGTVDDTFAGRPAHFRAIYDKVLAFVSDLGPVHEDAVAVGVFLKADRTIAQLRPRSADLALWLSLARRLSDPRISRTVPGSGGRTAYMIPLRSAEDVDDRVREWLAEAFEDASNP